MKRSKKYTQAAQKITANTKYSLEEAAKLLPEVSISKFPGTITAEILIDLKEKQKKETIRGSYSLPHSFGKETRVLVFASSADQKKAEKADVVGGEELIKEIEAGKHEFDVVISTPEMMPKIARLGKILGTKGLMPNPKNGTITTDLAEAVTKFKAGLRNFKSKDAGKITGLIGKSDMKAEALVDNFQAFYKVVMTEVKRLNTVVKSVKLAPTMGPSILVEVSSVEA